VDWQAQCLSRRVGIVPVSASAAVTAVLHRRSMEDSPASSRKSLDAASAAATVRAAGPRYYYVLEEAERQQYHAHHDFDGRFMLDIPTADEVSPPDQPGHTLDDITSKNEAGETPKKVLLYLGNLPLFNIRARLWLYYWLYIKYGHCDDIR
jgi:hypothetical protein